VAQTILCYTSLLLAKLQRTQCFLHTDSCPQLRAGTRYGQKGKKKEALIETLKSGMFATAGNFFTQEAKNLTFSSIS